MTRAPTDRARAWQPWRDRIEGRTRAVDDMPQPGLYKAKRYGRWAPVQIDLVQDIDPVTGELVSEERFVAFVGRDAFYDETYVGQIWLRCAGHPIDEGEFERLLKMPPVSDLTRNVIT